MNVVILSDSGQADGGSSKVAIQTALAMAERGHRVGFFAGTSLDPRLSALGGLAIGLGAERLSKEGGLSKRIAMVVGNGEAASQFAGFLGNFDRSETIVHAHTYGSLLSGKTLAIAFDRGFATAFTCHYYLVSCPNSAFYNFRKHDICRLKPLSPACIFSQCTDDGAAGKAARVLRASIDSRVRKTSSRFDRVVFVSDFSRRILEERLPIGARGSVIYNPCEVDKLARIPVEPESPVVWLGRLVPEKDPVLMARGAALAGCSVVFCGDGPLRAEAQSEYPSATITGWVASDAAVQHVRRARALVMTSRWYEAAPLVVPEALAAGVLAVVPDTCAAQEFIVDGETGFVFRSGDAEDLARVLRLIQDDALAEKMGRRAFERYWDDPLTMDRHLGQLVPLYEGAIQSRRGGKAMA